ncbi:MAG: AIPR family protein [Anaerolineales bacterium]|nr:AIPR family protein [Anaerolineales bacterium]
MANRIDWSQIEARITAYQDIYACPTRSQALAYVVIETELGLDTDDIIDVITDGADDRGIDAIFINEDSEIAEVHIFQFKCTPQFEKTKNNFPSNEIDKVLSFIEDLMEAERDPFRATCNPILWDKVEQIWGTMNDRVPSFTVHFAGNMLGLTDAHRNRVVSQLKRYGIFFKEHTLDSIANAIIKKNVPQVDSKLKLVEKQYFERSDHNIRGLIATLPATEIIDLISDPENPAQVRQHIFDDNVRVYLTKSNRIDSAIIESALSDENYQFWYKNNGITITCDSFDYSPTRSPVVQLTNVQIVNGGQTSNALFEAYKRDPKHVDDVLLLVRIYETKHAEISSSIAESTNSQTPIRSRDLRSNDLIQKKLQDSFLSKGFFYERKSKEFREQIKDKRIDAKRAAQAYLAYHIGEPSVAYGFPAQIFGKYYDFVFNEDTTSDDMLTALKLYWAIEKRKLSIQRALRSGQKIDNSDYFLIYGSYHVLFAVGSLCDQQNLDKWDYEVASTQLDDAINVIKQTTKYLSRKNPNITLNGLFKDSKTKSQVQQRVRKRFSQR